MNKKEFIKLEPIQYFFELCRQLSLSYNERTDLWLKLNEPGRYYHNWQHHIKPMCKRYLHNMISLTDDEQKLLAVALFHDAIYVPGASNNEELSAQYFEKVFTDKKTRKFKKGRVDKPLGWSQRQKLGISSPIPALCRDVAPL